MHRTLLGVLLTLAPRALYHHAAAAAPLADQQVAGLVMLTGGATSTLAGGLWLVSRLLRDGKVGDAPLGEHPRRPGGGGLAGRCAGCLVRRYPRRRQHRPLEDHGVAAARGTAARSEEHPSEPQ